MVYHVRYDSLRIYQEKQKQETARNTEEPGKLSRLDLVVKNVRVLHEFSYTVPNLSQETLNRASADFLILGERESTLPHVGRSNSIPDKTIS